MPMLGISSVEDITASDRLGLPVFLSARPRGKTLRLHAGKGLHVDDARAGALMEAVEYAVAESSSARGPDCWLPFDALVAALPVGVRLGDFAPRIGIAPPHHSQMPAVYCEEIGTRRKALLPAELVLMPCPSPKGSAPLYGWSTNGLASGNTLQEATLHALLEILERDAIAMNLSRDESSRITAASLPTALGNLIAAWQDAGIEATTRFLPNVFGLACFEVTIHEPTSQVERMSRGWGCHFDREVALSRAICEAAQLRLSTIHPLWRLSHARYGRTAAGKVATAMDRSLAENGNQLLPKPATDCERTLDFSHVPHSSFTSVGVAFTELLRRLAMAGLTRVFRYRMYVDRNKDALLGLHVVKVVVPRCESALGSHVRMGPRMMERIMGASNAN